VLMAAILGVGLLAAGCRSQAKDESTAAQRSALTTPAPVVVWDVDFGGEVDGQAPSKGPFVVNGTTTKPQNLYASLADTVTVDSERLPSAIRLRNTEANSDSLPRLEMQSPNGTIRK